MVVLNTILRPGLFTLIAVLSLFSWAQVARITRAETMSVKERDYVTAARNLGAGSFRIAVEHIVPMQLSFLFLHQMKFLLQTVLRLHM